MEPTEPDFHSTKNLLHRVSTENAALRELLTAVAQNLKWLACSYPEHSRVLLPRATRIRRRV